MTSPREVVRFEFSLAVVMHQLEHGPRIQSGLWISEKRWALAAQMSPVKNR